MKSLACEKNRSCVLLIPLWLIMVSIGYFHVFSCIIMEGLCRKVCVERSVFHREQAAVAPKVCSKFTARDRQGSRPCPAVCQCKAIQTGVSTVVQAPQFRVSSFSERDMAFKQVEGKGKEVDHTVTVSVRLERRIWTFCFVKNDMLPSPVQICSHQLLVKASPEVS